jgi:hypothetical protein
VTYGTYADVFGVDWIRVGTTTASAASVTFTATVDALCLIFTISKTQGSYQAGQTFGWIVASYGGGAVGCTYSAVALDSVTYNNTVSCT